MAASAALRLPHVDRRSAVLSAAAACLPALQQPANAISATTMTGKTKPELGIILVDEVKTVGKSGIAGDLVLADGLVASVKFDSAWPLAEGGYYDVEAKNRENDAAYVQVAKLPGGASFAKLPKTFFTDTLLSVDGRYGAYGAPTDIKVVDKTAEGSSSRQLDVTFTVISPGAAEVQRKAIVTAIQPKGSSEVVMLMASTSVARWKKGGKEDCLRASESFAVTTRPTSLAAVASSDYRFGKTSGPSSMKSRNDGF